MRSYSLGMFTLASPKGSGLSLEVIGKKIPKHNNKRELAGWALHLHNKTCPALSSRYGELMAERLVINSVQITPALMAVANR
jgi:hypothetical protein